MGDSEDKTTYAVCAIIVAELEKQNENKRRRKRGPTKTWIKRRTDKGAFLNLNLELRGEDPTSYRRWLRLTESQFKHLLNEISPRIQKQNTKFGKPISPAERLTVTLRFLATGNTFRDLSWEFRIGERTISYIVTETCAALYETLKYTFQVPTSKEHWMAIAKHFQDRWNVPHCLGAIDGKHIVMRKPINSGSHYHNYKGTESIVLLAVVDANYTFRYVDVGTQGRISDGGVWNKCNLKELIDVNALDIPPAHPLPGQDIVTPYVFLADDAFGLKPYILKPYGGSDLTLEERICNYR
ncbi:protein ANTAGONIST OF LIKE HETEROCHROMATIN PROTEIN 1-like [Centruroides sculpturatus]|uniref:protein ANTAGONIST OF LIKE HETEROCHROMATIN PROTEIN 1-like n=1 Tax=Centruroides sculpturatus TaxID=218467 RepID=UPI000C6DCD67|nr:protein ANTAGONIST OF LIKE HETEROCHROMATIN PROTEIN 1-like [Centruroides sculpturatus]